MTIHYAIHPWICNWDNTLRSLIAEGGGSLIRRGVGKPGKLQGRGDNMLKYSNGTIKDMTKLGRLTIDCEREVGEGWKTYFSHSKKHSVCMFPNKSFVITRPPAVQQRKENWGVRVLAGSNWKRQICSYYDEMLALSWLFFFLITKWCVARYCKIFVLPYFV